MLKKKEELHYRRGYQSAHCSGCDHYREIDLTGIGGAALGEQARCDIIGLEPGRMYRISPNNICDMYDNRLKLERLRGNGWTP